MKTVQYVIAVGTVVSFLFQVYMISVFDYFTHTHNFKQMKKYDSLTKAAVDLTDYFGLTCNISSVLLMSHTVILVKKLAVQMNE